MKRKFNIACLLPGLLLYGCTVGPDYVKPNPPMPEKWHAGAAGTELHADQYPDWWKSFKDPILDDLIQKAIAANLNYQSTLARIRDARTQRTVAMAAGLPSLSAHNSINRRLNNINLPTTGGNTAGGGFVGAGNQVFNIFQTGLDAQWEIDLFGGIRRNVETAEANIELAVEDSRAVLVSLLAEIASNYLQLRANQQLMAVTEETIKNQEDTVYLMQVRHNAGLASQLEIAQSQVQLANSKAQLPVYSEACKLAMHAIAILLADEPGKLDDVLAKPAPIPSAANPAATDLPSELLLRRPDIRRAERQLAVSNAQIGVATAAQYPRFNLTAFLGLQNTNLSDLTPISKSWSLGSSLTTPLFNWGNIQANIESKEAQNDQAFIAYKATLLTAFQEVENALVSYDQEQKKSQSLQEAVAASELAVALASELHGKGLTAFLDVLTAQRTLYQAQRDLLQSESAISTQLVALYKALGGGWQTIEAGRP